MAKYDVRRSCGHVEECKLFGKIEERKRRIARMETSPCKECVRASHEDENVAAATANSAAGLPTLNGSDKQIAWAEQIRQRAVTAFAEAQSVIEAAAPDADSRQRALDTLATIRTRTMGTTDAGIWIDIRDRVNRPYIINAVKQTLIAQSRR